MADPTTWDQLLNSFVKQGQSDGVAPGQIPPVEAVTAPRWTRAYWNYALGQDPWKAQWYTRYDDGRGLSRTAGIAMIDGDEGLDGKDSAWPKFNMGAYHVIQALAGSGTDVTSLPSFTHAEQQLTAAIRYFDNYHIGIDQWRAKLDAPESGWKGSASAAFADVLLRLSRAFEEINTLTGGPSGSGGYLGAIAQAREGLRAAVNQMQSIYETWGSQPAWSPAGALQQVLSGLNVDHKDSPVGHGTTKLLLNGAELGYVDQQGTWDLIEQHAKDLWLQTAQQYLNGMVNDVHIKLAQSYNGAALALKPVPTSIENAINGGGYGGLPPGTGGGTGNGTGNGIGNGTGNGTGGAGTGNGIGDGGGNGLGDGDGPGEGGTGLGDGNGNGNGLGEGQTGLGDGDGNGKGLGSGSGLGEGQTGLGEGQTGLGDGNGGGLGDGNGLKDLLANGSGGTGTGGTGNTDGTGGTYGTGGLGKNDLPPGQTDTRGDHNQYVPPYLRAPNSGPPPGSTDLNRKNPYSGLTPPPKGTTGDTNKNTTYKPPRPGQTDLKRWVPHDIKQYTPPPLSSGHTGTGAGTGMGTGKRTGAGSGGLQTTSGGGSGGSGAGGTNGARGPMSTSSNGSRGPSVPLFPPMANGMGGKGQENQERERTTWLAEDASVWGTDPELAPTVLGRPGTDTALYADTSYLGENDEWQSAPGPHGGRPGTSGGGSRAGQGGTGESRPGQRDGHGQGSSAQRHG